MSKSRKKPAPQVNEAPPQQGAPVHPYANLLNQIWSSTWSLGAQIDYGSFTLLQTTALEYELTLKQLAFFATKGDRNNFDMVVNHLNTNVRSREALILNVCHGALAKKQEEAKAQEKAPAKKRNK